MFRRLIMAIFRLYMKYLLSSYTKHTWAVYTGKRGGKVGTRSRICQKGWTVWVTCGGPWCYQAMCKLVTVKSMLDIICLCVLCNYTA